jgi:protein tyrosine phosphatase
VVIERTGDDEDSDYVNASYISVSCVKPFYVLSSCHAPSIINVGRSTELVLKGTSFKQIKSLMEQFPVL